MNNLIFIYGADSYHCLQALNAIKKKYIDTQMGDVNLMELWGANLTVNSLKNQIATPPFLAAKRLVIVRDLLSSKNKTVSDELADIIKKIPESTLLLFYESTDPDKRTSAYKLLLKQATVKTYAPLQGATLMAWIKKTVTQSGGSIDMQTSNLLAERVGSDLWALKNEIEKLVLYNPTITRESILTLTPTNAETIVFALTDQIMAGKVNEALKTLDQLRFQGQADVFLLNLLSGTIRNAISVNLAKREHITSSSELARTLKLHPFVVQKTLSFANQVPLQKLITIYRHLLTVDVAIKTGTMEAGPALDVFVASLKR